MLNWDFWIPWPPERSGDPGDVFLRDGCRPELSGPCPRRRGWGLRCPQTRHCPPPRAQPPVCHLHPRLAPTGSEMSWRRLQNLSFWRICKFFQSMWRLLSKWLQKCVFISLSLFRHTYWRRGENYYFCFLMMTIAVAKVIFQYGCRHFLQQVLSRILWVGLGTDGWVSFLQCWTKRQNIFLKETSKH